MVDLSPERRGELKQMVVKCVQEHFPDVWFKASWVHDKLLEEGAGLEYIHVTVTLGSLKFDRVIAQQWVGMYYTYKLRRKDLWRSSFSITS